MADPYMFEIRLSSLEATVKRWKQPQDGARGLAGRDGRDIDPVVIAERIDSAVSAAAAKIQAGSKFDPAGVKALIAWQVNDATSAIRVPVDGKQGDIGPRGSAGQQGPQGDIGPMPRHEWKGTELRFEQDPGVWGKYTDLRGPAGEAGIGGGGFGAGVLNLPEQNMYFPSGW